MKTPRILHIIDSNKPHAGEFHSVLAGLLTELSKLGWSCQMIATDEHDHLIVHDLGQGAFRNNPLSLEKTTALLDDHDLVHFHGASGLTTSLVSKAITDRSIPYVISPYGQLTPNPWRRPTITDRMKRLFRIGQQHLRRSAAIVADNDGEARTLLKLRLCNRIETLPVGITGNGHPSQPSSLLDQPELLGKRLILFLGPIDPIEGLVPLLKACEDVVLDAPDWHLVLAGRQCAQWHSMIQAAIERRNLANRVTFFLDAPTDLQQALLHRCSLVLQPSLLDQAPIAALSGLAHQRPCIVSSRCRLYEVSKLDAGWEVEPRKESLAEALRNAVSCKPTSLSDMGIRGFDIVRQHRAWSVLTPQYASLYESVLSP